jgi:hypothetical protein
MANIKLVFKGTAQSKTEEHELVAYANTNGEIYLCIEMDNNYPSFICLDKPTAVKLVKELKLQISYLD